ncbi:MAG: hypothetical protein R2762_27185 [Bryobacteraceae bacterium]
MNCVRVLLAVGAAAALAQESPREQQTRRFEQNAVAVGAPFPKLALYDGDGKPFHTRQLVGSYSVLITGCLT